MDLAWESLPPKKVRDWAAISAELRKRPGEWALVAERANSSYVTYINRGKLKGFVEGEFEASGRNNVSEGLLYYDTYARYVGPKKAK